MNLAISNIAWPQDDTPAVLELLQRESVGWVEIAPSRIWTEPVETAAAQRRDLVRQLSLRGIRAISLHSLLYTRPDLGLFLGRETDANTVRYLSDLADLAADLGARWLVFGSPRNRKKGDLPFPEACRKAAEVFGPAGDAAHGRGVTLLIEPLTAGETDFVRTAGEGIQLVRTVASRGFSLHLDAKSVAGESGDLLEILRSALPYARHFHVNDPDLAPLGTTAGYHAAMGQALRKAGYSGHVSIEMKTVPDHRTVISRSLAYAKRFYMGQG